MLSVGDGILDDLLKEHLQDTASLLVDEAGDALNTTTTSKASDGGLGDTLNVVAQNLSREALSATLSSSLTCSLTTARHTFHYCIEIVAATRPGVLLRTFAGGEKNSRDFPGAAHLMRALLPNRQALVDFIAHEESSLDHLFAALINLKVLLYP